MPELNSSFLKEIVSALNSTRFSEGDFDLGDEEYGELLRIEFKYDDRYSFVLKEEEVTEEVTTGMSFSLTSESYSKSVTKLFTYESPGEYKAEDKKQVSSFSDVPKRIASWCHNIHREISNETSVDQDIERAKEAFKESISIEPDDPDSKFSKEEVEELTSKLETLYSKVSELSEKYHISESELEKLKGELESIKDNAKVYKKGIWAKMTENKMTNFVFEFLKSKEGRKLIVESIKKLGSGM
ncbi:hypothetical protein F1529_14450 [Alcanivorax sp. VBW004]|uniref:hypothetical protein n=1 Tax=Alcanivorax sp. VBW004 TaxID=1287708 RepID=UPI0012BD72AD|nr:hypothetical protein [Alcanivorax sp. VBW004]MTT53683.1 hypothetical protein [Alcanivorax sp. VBW004]